MKNGVSSHATTGGSTKSLLAKPSESSLAGRLMKHRDSGLIFALTIMILWACMLYHCLFRHKLNFLTTPFLVLIQIYLYTGLFITAHDSIHGTVCSNATINYWVGKICLLSFAGFDYDFIREEHWKHHSHAGLAGEDPDFHHGKPQFLLWIF